MIPSERPLPWLPPISLVVIVMIVGTISFSSVRFDPFSVTGQLLVLFIILRAFCYWPPLVRWIQRMPVPHRTLFVTFIASMVLGHYTLNPRAYFPFVAWEIFPFVDERDPVTCNEFIATTSSGRQVRLLVEQLFPSIVQIYPLDDPHQYPPKTLERLARVLADAYNSRHADDPARQVDLVTMSVHLHPHPGESRDQPSCELLRRYDISSAR